MRKASVAAYLFSISLVTASVAAIAPSLAGTPHDGVWTVSLVTKAGDCSRSLSSRIEVREGRVSKNLLLARISGAINTSGFVSLRVSGTSEAMNAQGKVEGEQASGSWTSASRNCSGTWTATRA